MAGQLLTAPTTTARSLTGAREFLARVVPWRPDAYVNLHWRFEFQGNNGAQTAWSGAPFKSLDACVRRLEFQLKNDSTRDIYVCMSSQRRAIDAISKKTGKPYLKAHREAVDAVSLKSLFVDVDVKQGGYPSPQAAAQAIAKFIADSGIPKPNVIVQTGSGGLHLYWALSQELDVARWSPLAFSLAEATKRHGLLCDTQCTVDAARILRVPDTFNHKTGTPRPTKLVGVGPSDYLPEKMEKALAPYTPTHIPSLPGSATILPFTGVTIVDDELSAGVDVTNDPIDIEAVRPECGFIDAALKEGGKGYDNALWNLTTLISTWVIDPRMQAHRMSDAHPSYKPDETDALFDRKIQDRATKNLGWPKCQTIATSGCTACASCKHLTEGKSPLNFRVQAALPAKVTTHNKGAVDLLPDFFGVDPDGYIFRTVVKEDGALDKIRMLSFPVRNVWAQIDPASLHFETRFGSHWEHVHLPFNIAASDDKAKTFFLDRFIGQDEKMIKHIRSFLVSWQEKLKDSKQLVVDAKTSFGWINRDGKRIGFAYGGRVWDNAGSLTPTAPVSPVVQSQYSPRGAIEPWKELCKITCDQERPELNVILATSFAAPLMAFTGHSGVLISVYGDSGTGKSTTLQLAQAVWGNPKTAVSTLDDTANSTFDKLGTTRSLPGYTDELKTLEDMKRFINSAFRLTQGHGKARLSSDIKQRDPGDWNTMLTSASNDSLLDLVVRATKGNNAGLYRIFEFEVRKGSKGQVSAAMVEQLRGRLVTNYGYVGLAYAEFLGANIGRLEREVLEHTQLLEVETNAINEERFWIAGISVLLLGAGYANELGFVQIDIAAMKKFLLGVLATMRGEKKEGPGDLKNPMNVADTLAQFLKVQQARRTLITTRIHTSVGKPAPGSIKPLCDISKLEQVVVHIGRDNKVMRISRHELLSWLSDHGINSHTFTKLLREIYNVKSSTNCRLGGGVDGLPVPPFNEGVYEFDLTDPAWAGVVDI